MIFDFRRILRKFKHLLGKRSVRICFVYLHDLVAINVIVHGEYYATMALDWCNIVYWLVFSLISRSKKFTEISTRTRTVFNIYKIPMNTSWYYAGHKYFSCCCCHCYCGRIIFLFYYTKTWVMLMKFDQFFSTFFSVVFSFVSFSIWFSFIFSHTILSKVKWNRFSLRLKLIRKHSHTNF